MAAWVYILECADRLYYVGSHRGEHPSTREGQHNAGVDPKAFTFRRRPVRLVWAGEFQWITDAIAFERRLKGWSRAKKQAVIDGRWDDLPGLSRALKGCFDKLSMRMVGGIGRGPQRVDSRHPGTAVKPTFPPSTMRPNPARRRHSATPP